VRGQAHILVAIVPALAVLGALRAGGVEVDTNVFIAVPLPAAVGALAPDIDHPSALIGNALPTKFILEGLTFLISLGGLSWFMSRYLSQESLAVMFAPYATFVRWAITAIVAGVALLVLSFVASIFLEHRGPTHSITLAVVSSILVGIGCVACAASWQYGLVFGLGCASHLLADSRTPKGCPAILWPFAR